MPVEEVSVRAIDKDNWYECCTLEVSPEQQARFESNAISLVQASFEHTLRPLAIYLTDTLVGFVMSNTQEEELGAHWIYRIMVDTGHQQMGIGTQATKQVITLMRQIPGCRRVAVGYHPDNEGSRRLYAGLGFKDRGDQFGREVAAILDLE